MTQDKLNYLITLAEERNVTKAAERLFITQPTLTAYVPECVIGNSQKSQNLRRNRAFQL